MVESSCQVCRPTTLSRCVLATGPRVRVMAGSTTKIVVSFQKTLIAFIRFHQMLSIYRFFQFFLDFIDLRDFMLCRFCESQTAEIFLLNLLVAQLNGAYGAVYDDMVGYARLTRGSIIATRLNRWGWQFEWGI